MDQYRDVKLDGQHLRILAHENNNSFSIDVIKLMKAAEIDPT